MYRTDISSLP